MKKALKFIITFLIMIFIASNVQARFSGTVNLVKSKTELTNNEEFEVELVLKDIHTKANFATISANLEYSDNLEYLGVTSQNGWTPEISDNIVMAYGNINDGDTVIGKLKFKVKSTASGEQYVKLTTIKAADGDGTISLNDTQADYTVTNSTNPSDPNTPTDPDNPDNPSDPNTPTNPDNPSNPSTPTDPDNPNNPSTPTDPDNPSNPSTPTDPDNPSNPSTPTDPDNPSNPNTPTDPDNPSNPSTPTDPDNPSNPGMSTNPDNPNNPSTPTDPDNPSNPGTSTNPDNPSNPGMSTNPDNPSTPINPNNQVGMQGSTNSSNKDDGNSVNKNKPNTSLPQTGIMDSTYFIIIFIIVAVIGIIFGTKIILINKKEKKLYKNY